MTPREDNQNRGSMVMLKSAIGSDDLGSADMHSESPMKSVSLITNSFDRRKPSKRPPKVALKNIIDECKIMRGKSLDRLSTDYKRTKKHVDMEIIRSRAK